MTTLRNLALTTTSFFLWSSVAAAQLIDSAEISGFSEGVRNEAGFSELSLGSVIATILNGALSLLAVVFIILMILAGFRWMNSGGNDETIKKAQSTIKNSIIGLILVLASWAITYYLFKLLPFSAPSSGGLIGN